MTLLSFFIISLSLSLSVSSQSQGQGDPEALTGERHNQPTKSFTPFQGSKPTYALKKLPDQYFGEDGGGNRDSQDQTGWNRCTENTWNQKSRCQTAWVNSLEDFCVWGPPEPGTIGDTEREAVAYCTTNKHGTRLIPDGTITGAHFVLTKDYAQITGIGDFTSINIPQGDTGGEMDSHGADDLSNPIGGVVYTTANPATNGKPAFVSEWTNFMGWNSFCFRVCWGENDRAQCQHIYDVLGCSWNIPANYEPGFESCEGDIAMIQGVYENSTFQQGDAVTPDAHPAPSSSQCSSASTIRNGLLAVSTFSTSTAGTRPTAVKEATDQVGSASNQSSAADGVSPKLFGIVVSIASLLFGSLML